MRADPPLPTVTAAAVVEIGAASIAAAARVQLAGCLVGFSRVKMPLRISTAACGLPELVHIETGDGWGICASAELAERVRRFFS